MKRIIVSLFFFSLVTKPVLADYILPPVKDRLVFLLSPKDVKFDNASLVFSVGQLKQSSSSTNSGCKTESGQMAFASESPIRVL